LRGRDRLRGSHGDGVAGAAGCQVLQREHLGPTLRFFKFFFAKMCGEKKLAKIAENCHNNIGPGRVTAATASKIFQNNKAFLLRHQISFKGKNCCRGQFYK
jgi:hypothetical protein